MIGISNARNDAEFDVSLPGQFTVADLFRAAGYPAAVASKR